MLAAASMVFFVLPSPDEAAAQSGNVRSFCFNSSTKVFILPSGAGECPSGSTIVQAPRTAKGFCVFTSSGKWVAEPTDDNPSLNATGTRCLDDNGVEYADFKSIASITQTYNPGGTNTNNGNSNNGNGNNGNTNTTPPVIQGNCDSGFHKSGPLCIPNSEIGSNKSFLKVNSFGELAALIVKILLYFAGIVAVIMAIIGGYQVMTAAGNEAQATNGRKTLINAIIGLVIVILSYVIISAVINFVTT
jgi:hypothetical protein